jgi:hypothetical protein
MKKIIVIIFFNLLFLSSFGQDSIKKIYHGFGAGFNVQLSGQYRFGKVPYFFYTWPRHKVALCMVIGHRPVNEIYNIWGDHYQNTLNAENHSRIIGSSVVYQFLPNHPAKIFDLYFEYRLTWILMKSHLEYIDAESNFSSFENLISFGMKIKFLKYFCFYTGPGLGIISNIGKYSHYKNIPLYNKTKFTFGFNAGLEFHL